MEEDDIPDTRVFVSGLPAHFASEQLGAHFAGRYQITDSVVVPNRRIGFVGFRNYTLAKNAVKYFNKSYIRMSKISVEIAKPVDFQRESNQDFQPEASAQLARTIHGSQTPLSAAEALTIKPYAPYESLSTKISGKRKRAETDDQNEDLVEYMRTMQPKSKSTWANGEPSFNKQTVETGNNQAEQNKASGGKDERKTKKKTKEPQEQNGTEGHAAETSDGERKRRKKEKRDKRDKAALLKIDNQPTGAEDDAEDKEARRKHKAEKKAKKLKAKSTVEGGVESLNEEASGLDDTETDIAQPEIPRSDNDWLRGKTSRLLDLVESEEGPADSTNVHPKQRADAAVSNTTDGLPISHNISDLDTGNVDTVVASNRTTETPVRVPNGRLFLRNLPFSTTEAELESKFAKYGSIAEVHVSKDFKSSSSKGVAFIQFAEPEAAESAMHTLDGTTFQGRLLHILPASDKKTGQLDEFTLSKLPLKKQKAIKQKKEASNFSFNWNSLYMNPDAVLASVADRLGVHKSEVLDPTSADAAVKQALAETNTIRDTKEYLQRNGVNINAFKNVKRDEQTILLKNFSFGTTSDEIRGLLDPFGSLTRLVLPPTGTMAVAQFKDTHMAAKALKNLAYRNLKGSVLFLEKAPEGIFDTLGSGKDPSKATTNDNPTSSARIDTPEQTTTTVFVRNLNFTTTTSHLVEVFKPLPGYLTATVKTRTDPKRPGEILSMGFGFVEFRNKDQARAAIAAMDGYKLDGHELLVKPSTKVLDAAEETRRADKAKKSERKTKIIIKNLPFEASKKDIRALFSTYGQLRTVRVPKKFDQSTRGFAFADFVTAKEAENAMEALANTHLLGRRLVLDFAAGDSVDPEEEIQALERKMGKQTEMINLSKITASGRKKFNVENRDGNIDF